MGHLFFIMPYLFKNKLTTSTFNFLNKYIMKSYLRALFVIFLIVSCSKESANLSSESNLISFSINGINSDFTITSNKTVEVSLAQQIDLSNLTAVFSVSPKAKVFVGSTIQTSGYSKNNYSNPLVITVVAEDGSKSDYTVIISFEPKINSFKLVELNTIQFTFLNLEINATVPSGTNLKNLTADFTVVANCTLYVNGVQQISGQTKNNFEQPVIYTLKKGADTVKQYTVTVTQAQNNLPIADAGADKIAFLSGSNTTAAATLDGSGSSDLEGPIVSYQWKSGSTIVGSTAIVNLNLTLGIHTYELTVTDSSGATATDSVVIDVRLQGVYKPIDANATAKTINLYNNIASIANSSKFIFGQEFPLSFQLNSLRTSLNTSDCKEVTGDHPGVFGIDPHYMLYKTAAQKQTHIDEAKLAYANGSIVTFDFHQQSRTDHQIYYNDLTSDSDKKLMYDIVNNLNGSRAWFYGELDQVLGIINNDLGFPVVFRLFHEMDGNWFWWGTKATNHSSQLYIDLYRLATDYIKARTNLVLFGWTPNQKVNASFYPGDAYVDVVGIDAYGTNAATLKANLIELSSFATNHGKVAVLSEVGKNDYINLTPTFWTSDVLAPIEQGGSDIRIAWVLAWFNAPWKSSQSDLFIPNSSSSTQIKNDFIQFKNSSKTLFQQDVKALNVYN